MNLAGTIPIWARRRFRRLLERGLSAPLARRIVVPTKRLPTSDIARDPGKPNRYPMLIYSSEPLKPAA